MKVRFNTKLGELHSWGLVSQALAKAMELDNHSIYMKSSDGLEHFPNNLEYLLLPGYHNHPAMPGDLVFINKNREKIILNKNQKLPEDIYDTNRPYDLEIAYTVPLQWCRRFYSETTCKMAIWNYESSIMPSGWAQYHRAIDYILPSSQYSYDIFLKNGIPSSKMIIVPHGVDTKMFNPNIEPFKLQTQKKVKLLSNAIPHARKCHDRIIEAYLNAFTGNDDVCLVLKTKFLEPSKERPFEVDVKAILEEKFKNKINPPEIEIVNSFVPDIGSLYTACNAVVSMSSTEGFCLLPNTEIDTLEGPKPIADAVMGSKVIGLDGNFCNIVGKTHRFSEEDIISIKRKWHFSNMEVTQKHPILAVKINGRERKQLFKDLKKGNLIAKWEAAENLIKGDLIVVPKPVIIQNNETILNISEAVPEIKEKNGKLSSLKGGYGTRGKITAKMVAKSIGFSTSTVRGILSGKYCGRKEYINDVFEKARALGWEPNTLRSVPAKIIFDEHCAEFIGLYLSEGHANKTSVIITPNKCEKLGLQKALSYSTYLLGYAPKLSIDKNVGRVAIHNNILASFMKKTFGGVASEKHIPEYLWGSKYINILIRWFFYGDGSCTKSKDYCFTSASQDLVWNITSILMSNGILTSIHKYVGKYTHFVVRIIKSHTDRFEKFIQPIKYDVFTHICNSNHSKPLEGESHFLVPIMKIKKSKHSGIVYNIHTDGTNSFTSYGMAVHNCLPLLEALSCESVVIAPRHGGQLDFLNDDNSLLVDTGEMKAPLSMQYWCQEENAVVGDPSVKHCSELMRKVYENPTENKERIIKSARETVEKFTWEKAAKQITDLAEECINNKKTTISYNNKKRVSYIIPYNMIGGGEVLVKETIKKLDKNKYEPTVIFPLGASKGLLSLFEGLDVRLEDLKNIGSGAALKSFIESEKPDIVHFYNSFQVYSILVETLKQGAWNGKLVETVHSELIWPDSMMKVATRSGVSMILGVSETICKKLIKMGNKNVKHLPQQIDWERFSLPKSKNILNEIGFPANRFTIGVVARLSPEKNIPMVISCARALPDCLFIVIGDGPQENILKQMASNLNNIYFLGHRNDVEKFYAAFDVLLLPSQMEGLPLTILESMSMGVPVVASNVGAVQEIIANGINGFIISGGVQSYITALTELMNDEKRLSISKSAFNFSQILKMRTESVNINTLYDMLG